MNIYSRQNIPSGFYVYAYLRQDNTPYYIGKGHKIRAWNQHDGGIHPPKDTSKIIILESNLTDIGALAIERRLIRWYGRKDLGTGILRNLTDGGDGSTGYVATEETRIKISVAGRGRKLKPRTKEHCEALSKAFTGKKLPDSHPWRAKNKIPWNKGLSGHLTQTEESNTKRSESLKGRNPWNKGKSPSKETLEKQQLARLGKKRGPYKKKGA
jgi:hypothetical protein